MAEETEMSFIHSFIKSIPGGEKLSNGEFNMIMDKAEIIVFHDKEPFCEQGTPCEMIGFLFAGFFKTSCMKNNKTVIKDLNFIGYNRIVTDFSSMVTGDPCRSSILSVKKSILVCFSKGNWEWLLDKIVLLNGISRHLTNMSSDTKPRYMERLEGMAKNNMPKRNWKGKPGKSKNNFFINQCSMPPTPSERL